MDKVSSMLELEQVIIICIFNKINRVFDRTSLD